MTEKALYRKLFDAWHNLDEEKYPQTCGLLELNLIEDGSVYLDFFDMACALQESDANRTMHPEIAKIVTEIYEHEISRGNCDAMNNMGVLYYTGRLGEANYKKAFELYQKAADLGDPCATENLGYCYYYGRVGEPDYEKAFQCFVKGALNGSLTSLYKLGDMYLYGYHVKKDRSFAGQIYKKCYEQMQNSCYENSFADICKRMGDVYFFGMGTPENYERALKYYQEAELYYYTKIKDGVPFSNEGLKYVTLQLKKTREIIELSLPQFD